MNIKHLGGMSTFSDEVIQDLIDKVNSIINNRKSIDDFEVVSELADYAALLIRHNNTTYKATINQLLTKLIALIPPDKLPNYYIGEFTSEADLKSAHPSLTQGGYRAHVVEDGALKVFIWNNTDSKWVWRSDFLPNFFDTQVSATAYFTDLESSGVTVPQNYRFTIEEIPSYYYRFDSTTDSKITEAGERISKEQLGGKVSLTNALETTLTDSSDRHAFADGEGRIYFQADPSGANAHSFNVIDPETKEVFATIDKEWLTNLSDSLSSSNSIEGIVDNKERDSFYFSDPDGYAVAKIDVSGVSALNFNIIDPETKEVFAVVDKEWVQGIGGSSSLTDVREDKETGAFHFVDAEGNIMASISPEGLRAIDFLDKDGNPITGGGGGGGGGVDDILDNRKTNGFFFLDKDGNTMAKVDPEGFQPNKYLSPDGDEIDLGSLQSKKAYGKRVVSLGDSHASSPWLSEFCSITGAVHDSEMQSYTRNNRVDFEDRGLMLGRSKALKAYCDDNDTSVDLILIENTHFKKPSTGTIDDYVPWEYVNFITFPTVYNSSAESSAAFNTDFPAWLSDIETNGTPLVKTAVRITYAGSYKSVLNFSSSGTLSAGTITLTLDGSDFPVTVTEGMTLEDALTLLNDWQFSNDIPDWNNSETKGLAVTDGVIELEYTGGDTPPTLPVSFNGGSTGVVLDSSAIETTLGSQDYYFNSLNVTEWTDVTKWYAHNGTNVYGTFKAVLEYLQNTFPEAELVVWGVQYLNVDEDDINADNSYLVDNGDGTMSRSLDLYYQDPKVISYLDAKSAMKEVASKYHVRFLDVDTSCGITIFNMFSGGYFPSKDLHPTPLGYIEWGKTLARLY